MAKYKTGDRVRLLKSRRGIHAIEAGAIGTVWECGSIVPYVSFDNWRRGMTIDGSRPDSVRRVTEADLELVVSPSMTVNIGHEAAHADWQRRVQAAKQSDSVVGGIVAPQCAPRPKPTDNYTIPTQSKLRTQVGGDHYAKMKIQPLEYILANDIPFSEGAVIKYVSRWRNKNGVEDLKKARQTIDVLIEYEESQAARGR